MTREISHLQQFAAALETIQPKFPPTNLQDDVRFTHSYFNMSHGEDARGPWNDGEGLWPADESGEYIDDPCGQVDKQRDAEVTRPAAETPLQWSFNA